MMEKNKLMINCDVCDTRKMKEEDYSHYEQITINADVVIENASSKSILSRLPFTLNHDRMIEVADDIDVSVKIINGSSRITGQTCVEDHTILIVNGSLMIETGTEGILAKYEEVIVNGSAMYPKSFEAFLNKMSVNGSVQTYPDDCNVMKSKFIIDKYFPLRAKEGSKYYAENVAIIKDESVDVAALAAKNVRIVTKKLIVPESKIEDSVSIVDENVEFVVVPDGSKLIYGDCKLEERLIRREGSNLFVYGDVEIDENADMDALCEQVEKLIVTGNVILRAEQEDAFYKMNAEYGEIIITKNYRKICNILKAKLDKNLFDHSPDGIKVSNAAKVIIADDVTPEMILDRLVIENCAKVSCNEEQESFVAIIAKNVAKIGEDSEEENDMGAEGIFGALKGLTDTKLINADRFVM